MSLSFIRSFARRRAVRSALGGKWIMKYKEDETNSWMKSYGYMLVLYITYYGWWIYNQWSLSDSCFFFLKFFSVVLFILARFHLNPLDSIFHWHLHLQIPLCLHYQFACIVSYTCVCLCVCIRIILFYFSFSLYEMVWIYHTHILSGLVKKCGYGWLVRWLITVSV